jgi:two-component system chemotaxis response regulator CheB
MLVIVLSGMGNDGAKSAEAVVRNGGKILVQDRASSVVWGMPGAIARQEIATAVLNPDEMVQKLNKMAAAKC